LHKYYYNYYYYYYDDDDDKYDDDRAYTKDSSKALFGIHRRENNQHWFQHQ